ncbi:unnamed protein product [Boreogadus saida]
MEARKVVLFGGHGFGIANNKKQRNPVACSLEALSQRKRAKERQNKNTDEKLSTPLGVQGCQFCRKATT